MCLFSPSLHPTPAEPPSLSHLHPPPWFCPYVLYSSSCNPLSSLSTPHSPLTIVRLFLTSMSLVIFCFLFSSIYYVPVKGEIIWYLSLTIYSLCFEVHFVLYKYYYPSFFFSCLFAWNILFQSFTLSLWRSFFLRCVSFRQHMCRSCFLVHSATLCHLILEHLIH